MGGQGSLALPSPYSLTPVLWKSDGLPLTQLWLILSDYITRYRSLVGLLKWAHWFLIRTPLNTSGKELGKYIQQIRPLLKISVGMFLVVLVGLRQCVRIWLMDDTQCFRQLKKLSCSHCKVRVLKVLLKLMEFEILLNFSNVFITYLHINFIDLSS